MQRSWVRRLMAFTLAIAISSRIAAGQYPSITSRVQECQSHAAPIGAPCRPVQAGVAPALDALGLSGPVELPDEPPSRPGVRESLGPLPFAPDCRQPYPNVNRALSLDADGNIYAIAICASGVELTVSRTGGATWSAPLVVAPTAGSVTVQAGTLPGLAIAAWSNGPDVTVSTTTDYGASMSAPALVVSGSIYPVSGLDVVAAGGWYHVAVASLAPGGVTTSRSLDRGASWEAPVTVPVSWVFIDLLHDAFTGNMEMVADDPNVFRSTSIDLGATYPPSQPLAGLCCVYYSDWALGCRRMYVTGNNNTTGTGGDLIWRYDLEAGTGPEQITSLPTSMTQSRSVAVDASGNAFTVATAVAITMPSAEIDLSRWGAGQPSVDAPVVIAASGQDPHVATCGADTAYVMYRDASTGTIQLVRFCLDPSRCCVPGTCAAPGVTLLRNSDVVALSPPAPTLAAIMVRGDGTGSPGATALDRVAPALRFPDFTPRALSAELAPAGEPLVFYELEEPDRGARILMLRKSGQDLVITF